MLYLRVIKNIIILVSQFPLCLFYLFSKARCVTIFNFAKPMKQTFPLLSVDFAQVSHEYLLRTSVLLKILFSCARTAHSSVIFFFFFISSRAFVWMRIILFNSIRRIIHIETYISIVFCRDSHDRGISLSARVTITGTAS